MKKWIVIGLIGVLTLTLPACGSGQKTESSTEQTLAAGEAATVAEAAETPAANTETSADANALFDMETVAGEYTFYGTYVSDQFVIIEDLLGTTTALEADGTGYLNWGKQNSKTISEWTLTGGTIVIKTEDSAITGFVGKGALLLEVGDADATFLECYVREDADTSNMPRITAEEWAERVVGSME